MLFLYDQKIDKATYEEQIDLLRQDAALAEIELNEAKLEEFDGEAILEFYSGSKSLAVKADALWETTHFET